MAPINPADMEAFLNDSRHAIMATNSANGAPQLTPVWYLFEVSILYISAQANTAKVRNLRRDPKISVCIDGGRGDSRYVVVAGTVELVEPGRPLQKQMRRRIIEKYHASQEAADRYIAATEDSPAVLIVVTPRRVFGHDYN